MIQRKDLTLPELTDLVRAEMLDRASRNEEFTNYDIRMALRLKNPTLEINTDLCRIADANIMNNEDHSADTLVGYVMDLQQMPDGNMAFMHTNKPQVLQFTVAPAPTVAPAAPSIVNTLKSSFKALFTRIAPTDDEA